MGWRWLMAGMGSLGEIQVTMESANVLMVCATAAMVFILGRRVGLGRAGEPATARRRVAAEWGGLAACAGYLLTRWPLAMYEGILLQRHLSAGIVALAFWSLLARRLGGLGVAYLLVALFYPIIIASVGAIAAVHEAILLTRTRRLPRGWLLAVAGGVVALLLIVVVRDVPDRYGQMVTLEQAKHMPIFASPEGRSSLFSRSVVEHYFTHSRTGLGFSPTTLGVGLATATFALWLAGWRRVPTLVWVTLIVSPLLWGVAHLVLFDLYLPNRHTRTTLAIAWLMFVALGTAGLRERVRARHFGTGTRMQLALAGVVLAGSAAFAWPTFVEFLHNEEHVVRRNSNAFLRRLPPDATVAGFPPHLDMVTLRTGRPTLISRETTQAYYLGFYDEIVLPRVRDSIAAYYATDWQTVDALHERYGVRAFLYHRGPMRKLAEEEPFRSLCRAAWQEMGDREPVMYRPPDDRILFAHGGLLIIRVGPAEDLPRRPLPTSLADEFDALPPAPRYDPTVDDATGPPG